MNSVNKTLYIPLYGKAFVSRSGIILNDPKAEEIWEKEKFPLKGKSKSKYLAYYMGMRAAVFDDLIKNKIVKKSDDTAVIHIGCGMDSRCERIGKYDCQWYDADFPDVIAERKKYYRESEKYHMICSDARNVSWLDEIRGVSEAVIVMEGVSMYFHPDDLKKLFSAFSAHFDKINIFIDCYSVFAAKMSKIKNPINDVGVTDVYGIDDPAALENDTGISFVREHEITPANMINMLKENEKIIFGKIYAGSFSKKLYRLYEYKK